MNPRWCITSLLQALQRRVNEQQELEAEVAELRQVGSEPSAAADIAAAAAAAAGTPDLVL